MTDKEFKEIQLLCKAIHQGMGPCTALYLTQYGPPIMSKKGEKKM